MARAGSGRNEDALSEIVGFVLVLALVVVASTLYLMYVVPAEGREDEITHMNKVQDRFVSYKTSVDGLWMRSLADISSSGTRGVSLSTSFDLGTGGGNTQAGGLFLSFMRPIGTAARMETRLTSPLELENPTTERIGLRVDGLDLLETRDQSDPDNPEQSYPSIATGSLSYHTDNYYWIQQNYYYKLGGVFLEQSGEGVSVKVAPPIAIYGVRNGTNGPQAVKVSISLINVKSPDSTVGGTGPLRIETRLSESLDARYRNKPVEDEVILWVQIPEGDSQEEWQRAWRQVFVDAAMKSGLVNAARLHDDSDEWVYIPNDPFDPDYPYAELHVRHHPLVPTNTKDVFLDLTEANLQVTFEYDEP